MVETFVFSLLILILTFVLYYAKLIFDNYVKYRHIPGVFQLLPVSLVRVPLLAPYIYLGAFKNFPSLSKKYHFSPLIRFTVGTQTMIALNSVEALKHVYLKKSKIYEKPVERYEPIKVFGDNIVSLPGGDIHKLHRSIVEPVFSERSLRNVVSVALESTKLLLHKLGSQQKLARIEVNSDMIDVTMDIIGKAVFGVDLKIFDDSDPYAKHKYDETKHTMSFYDALNISNTLGLLKSFLPYFIQSSFLFNRVNRAFVEVDKYLDELVVQREVNYHQGGEKLDLLNLFLDSNRVNDKKLTLTEIKSDAYIMLLAGHETSAVNLSYLLYEIAKSKDVQQRLHEEIDQVIGNRDPTFDDIANLSYVNACIKETLRLHPPIAATVKMNTKDDVIDGYHIPKGTTVLIPIYGTQRNPEVYPNPDQYLPERFLNKQDSSVTFLPFSFGTRKCVGKTFSYVETATIITEILRHYWIGFEDGTPEDFTPEERVILTCKISKLHLVLHPRMSTTA